MLGRNRSRRVRLKLKRETLRQLGADDLGGSSVR